MYRKKTVHIGFDTIHRELKLPVPWLITREYYGYLYAYKSNKFEEMENVCERYKLPKLTQEETEYFNTPVSLKETTFVVKNLLFNNTSGSNCSVENFPNICYI